MSGNNAAPMIRAPAAQAPCAQGGGQRCLPRTDNAAAGASSHTEANGGYEAKRGVPQQAVPQRGAQGPENGVRLC